MKLNEKKILITEIFFHCDKQPTIIQQIRMLSWSLNACVSSSGWQKPTRRSTKKAANSIGYSRTGPVLSTKTMIYLLLFNQKINIINALSLRINRNKILATILHLTS